MKTEERRMHRRAQEERGRLMTEGSIWRQLVRFSIPLLIGNLFQQFYNTVDSIVVGNFVSTQALAAVGSTTVIINTIIGFFTGLSTGAGVVISQAYGAQDHRRVQDAVHTTLLFTVLSGIVFSFIGVAAAPAMLSLMTTPHDVLADAERYLEIYFSGACTVILYNMGSGILRAVGDSRRPLYFLIVSALLNVVLDLLFVIAFGMGVAGVAIATVISQGVSAVLVLLALSKSHESYRLRVRELRIHGPMLVRVLALGMPAAIQMMVTAFSNVFVQGYINHFGSACMAGWSSYLKIDQFVMLPMQAIGIAATTFVGQNIGAHNIRRAEAGTRTSLALAVGITLTLSALLIAFARPLLMLFTPDADVLDYGVLFIRTNTPFLCICCLNQVFSGSLRGAGDTKAPTVIMLSSFVVFRQVYLFVISHVLPGSVQAVSLGYPLGWVLCSLLAFLYYWKSGWRERACGL